LEKCLEVRIDTEVEIDVQVEIDPDFALKFVSKLGSG